MNLQLPELTIADSTTYFVHAHGIIYNALVLRMGCTYDAQDIISTRHVSAYNAVVPMFQWLHVSPTTNVDDSPECYATGPVASLHKNYRSEVSGKNTFRLSHLLSAEKLPRCCEVSTLIHTPHDRKAAPLYPPSRFTARRHGLNPC